MNDLIAGYRRFRAERWPERRATFERLADRGQSPQAMVIACSDSRVDPTMIFSAEPGQLFVLKNVANLVPPYAPDMPCHATSAALEFAVRVLEVPHLIVMGHAMCGGIKALVNGEAGPAAECVVPWMRIAEPARVRALARAPRDAEAECGREAIKLSLEHLRTFPWIAERVAAGTLRLTGTSFDIRSGVLTMLGPTGAFAPV